MTLKEVVADSNKEPHALHVAIHTNAMGGTSSGKARGCEVFVHTKTSPAMPFALNLYKRVAEITPTADRGIKEGIHHLAGGKPLYELAYTNAPACLIEIAFHDNEADVLWLHGHKDDIASAIAASILDFLGVPLPSSLEHSLWVINQLLKKHSVTELSPAYWTQNAVPGGACNGEYVAMALNRIASALE
jgi:N-acetylmuramoyl-L-alanine amidase